MVVLWEGHAWQRDKPRAWLERARALPAWEKVWNPRHDALLETTAGAAFSLEKGPKDPLLFLGRRDHPATTKPTCQETQPELARMLAPKTAGTLLRFAATLPASLREELGQGRLPQAAALASILRVSGSLEWVDTPKLSLRFELSNTPDARRLGLALEDFRQAAKQHPDLLLLGLVPHLESLSLTQDGAAVEVRLALDNDEAMALLGQPGRPAPHEKQP